MRAEKLMPPTEEQEEIIKCGGYNPDRWLVASSGKNFLEIVSSRRTCRRILEYSRVRGKVIIKSGKVW